MYKILLHGCVWLFALVAMPGGMLLSESAHGAWDKTGDSVDIARILEFENLSDQLQYHVVPDSDSSIQQVLRDQALSKLTWQTNQASTPAFGFSDDVFWFRLRVNNPSSVAIQRLLVIKNPNLDEIRFYQVNRLGLILDQLKTGDENPSMARPYYHHNLILPFSVQPYSENVLYFRVKTKGALEFPVAVWSPLAFQQQDQWNLLMFGALFGILLVMGAYNFFIYALAQDSSMFYYALHSLFLMLFLATIHGFSAQFLWPEYQWLRENALVLICPLTLCFSALFSSRFLQLALSYRRVNRLFGLMAGLCVLMLILAPFVSYSLLMRASALLTVPVCLISILMGVVRWREGYLPARYFVIAWAAFFVAITVFSLSKLAIVPSLVVNEYAVQLGAVAESVLFAFALADRLSAQRRAFQEAQRKALELQKAANESLEARVNNRTRELQQAMDELATVNQRLQALTMQDGLTGIRNRRFFDEQLALEWARCLRAKVPLSLLLIDIDYFKDFNDRYGHLVGDECLKLVASIIDETVTRPSDTVARYGGEEFVVILPETNMSGAVHVAENLRSAVAIGELRHQNKQLQVTVSVGIATLIPKERMLARDIIDLADRSLYLAKSAGRNCIRVSE